MTDAPELFAGRYELGDLIGTFDDGSECDAISDPRRAGDPTTRPRRSGHHLQTGGDTVTLSIPEKIRRTLISFGSSIGEVEESLTRLGVRGRKGTGCDCPVSNALKLSVPETAGQWGSGAGHYWVRSAVVDLAAGGTVRVPLPVRDFIDHFDAGGFPHLDSEATP